jgi:hypothetical protein
MHEIAKILVDEDVIETSRKLGLENRLLLDQAEVRAFNIMGPSGLERHLW